MPDKIWYIFQWPRPFVRFAILLGVIVFSFPAASRRVRRSRRPVLVASDFNLPVDSIIYRQGQSSLTNAFSKASSGFGYSKFARWHGVRIDHILGGPGWRCRRCGVGPDLGSDHRPVIADMVWTDTR